MAQATKVWTREGEPQNYQCQNCGEVFTTRQSGGNAFYCSPSCSYERNKCPGGCGNIRDCCTCRKYEDDEW